MKQLLPTLLLCTGLFAAACGKDTPEPEADLQGRWNIESKTYYRYDASGKPKSNFTTSEKSYYMVISANSLSYHSTSDGSHLGTYNYSRQGKDFKTPLFNSTITELTIRKLTLRVEDAKAPNGEYNVTEDHYTR